jgi:hypothetical protein
MVAAVVEGVVVVVVVVVEATASRLVIRLARLLTSVWYVFNDVDS